VSRIITPEVGPQPTNGHAPLLNPYPGTSDIVTWAANVGCKVSGKNIETNNIKNRDNFFMLAHSRSFLFLF
jgi:hypothetical protein